MRPPADDNQGRRTDTSPPDIPPDIPGAPVSRSGGPPMRQERGNSAEAGRAQAGASRELDAMIAEKVMGWTLTAPVENGCDFAVGSHRDGSSARVNWGRTPTGAERTIPLYSSDIASAFQVVAEVQRRFPGMRFSLLGGDECWGYRHSGATDYDGQPVYECVTTRREVFGWRARFFGGEDPTKHYPLSWADEHADTIPLAIALAALKAIESGSREGNRHG